VLSQHRLLHITNGEVISQFYGDRGQSGSPILGKQPLVFYNRNADWEGRVVGVLHGTRMPREHFILFVMVGAIHSAASFVGLVGKINWVNR
jgi:hypothetical protein